MIAIDIQRQRDVGLGTLNQTRKALNMSLYHRISDLTSDPVLQSQLQTLYSTPSPTSATLPKAAIDNIDLFVGGLAEKHAEGGPGWSDVSRDYQTPI